MADKYKTGPLSQTVTMRQPSSESIVPQLLAAAARLAANPYTSHIFTEFVSLCYNQGENEQRSREGLEPGSFHFSSPQARQTLLNQRLLEPTGQVPAELATKIREQYQRDGAPMT